MKERFGIVNYSMIVIGLLTTTMLVGTVNQEFIMEVTFGESIKALDSLQRTIIASWSFLVFLIGGALIYGAIYDDGRKLALILAIVSKIAFIGILLQMDSLLVQQSITLILTDCTAIAVLIFCFLKREKVSRMRRTHTNPHQL